MIAGKLDDQFLIDIFQAGAGTCINMNVNEVIANRAIEILGGKKGNYKIVNPNDHVNMSQSTNDTMPSVAHIATYLAIRDKASSITQEPRRRAPEKIKRVQECSKDRKDPPTRCCAYDSWRGIFRLQMGNNKHNQDA